MKRSLKIQPRFPHIDPVRETGHRITKHQTLIHLLTKKGKNYLSLSTLSFVQSQNFADVVEDTHDYQPSMGRPLTVSTEVPSSLRHTLGTNSSFLGPEPPSVNLEGCVTDPVGSPTTDWKDSEGKE